MQEVKYKYIDHIKTRVMVTLGWEIVIIYTERNKKVEELKDNKWGKFKSQIGKIRKF